MNLSETTLVEHICLGFVERNIFNFFVLRILSYNVFLEVLLYLAKPNI